MRTFIVILLSWTAVNLLQAQSINETVYDLQWPRDGYTMGASAGILLGSYFVDRSIPLITAADIARLNPDDVWSWDRTAIGRFDQSASSLSDVFRDAVLVAPLALFLGKKSRKEWRQITFLYAETVVLTSGITTMVKGLSQRVRPYAYDADIPLDFKLQKNTRKSFYSGHTSHVASLSFLTASIYEDMYPDSPWRYAVWTGAILIPAATAVARVLGGRHFPSDVVIGYGVGAAVGYFIPKLHKSKRDQSITVVPLGTGALLTYTF